MNIRRKLLLTATFCGVFSLLFGQKVYNVTDFGLIPDTERNASPLIQRILNKMQSECIEGEPVTLKFASRRYSFREDGATIREYYISNHDQTNPKTRRIVIRKLEKPNGRWSSSLKISQI